MNTFKLKQLKERITIKRFINYSQINTEVSWRHLWISTGEPDVRTFSFGITQQQPSGHNVEEKFHLRLREQQTELSATAPKDIFQPCNRSSCRVPWSHVCLH
jgi:hypothetical protein